MFTQDGRPAESHAPDPIGTNSALPWCDLRRQLDGQVGAALLGGDHQHRPVLAAAVPLLERHPGPDDLARVRGAVGGRRVRHPDGADPARIDLDGGGRAGLAGGERSRPGSPGRRVRSVGAGDGLGRRLRAALRRGRERRPQGIAEAGEQGHAARPYPRRRGSARVTMTVNDPTNQRVQRRRIEREPLDRCATMANAGHRCVPGLATSQPSCRARRDFPGPCPGAAQLTIAA